MDSVTPAACQEPYQYPSTARAQAVWAAMIASQPPPLPRPSVIVNAGLPSNPLAPESSSGRHRLLVTLRNECLANGATAMIADNLHFDPSEKRVSVLDQDGALLQAMVLALGEDHRLVHHLSAREVFTELDITTDDPPSIEPDAEALADLYIAISSLKPRFLRAGMAAFLTESCKALKALEAATDDTARLRILVRWLDWQSAALEEARHHLDRREPVPLEQLQQRYALKVANPRIDRIRIALADLRDAAMHGPLPRH